MSTSGSAPLELLPKTPLATSTHQHGDGSSDENESLNRGQFVKVNAKTEWLEDYVMGGYHPVHLGDVLKERYRIVGKLGHGKYSTVWLAQDAGLREYVALKINTAYNRTPGREADILKRLRFHPSLPSTARLPIPRLFDSFDLKGPNGVHNVLVLELLVGNLAEFVSTMYYRARIDEEFRDKGSLRQISRQIVYAVHHLHTKGIIHRDIQPANIMFALENPGDAINEAHLLAHTFPLHRVDGRPRNEHSPAYVVAPAPLCHNMVDHPLLSTSHIVLSDFGSASTLENSNDGNEGYPASFRPPEILLGLPLSEKCDIWALGCTIFYLMTFRNVFHVDQFQNHGEQQDTDHLESIIGAIGPMPERMLQFWKGRQSVVDEAGHLLPNLAQDPLSEPLTVQLSKRRHRWMSSDEATAFEDFLRLIFQYEPENRPGAQELLRHRWLMDEKNPFA